MPNGGERTFKRLCFALEGFRRRFGHWPTRVRVYQVAISNLRDRILSPEEFALLEQKVALVADEEAGFIAEDDDGNLFDYGAEGPSGMSRPRATEWLGISPCIPEL